MVVGNGLLARAFEHYKDNDQVIIFASGVSNSQETDEAAFDREHDLLMSMPKDKLLVYFSTCSVYDYGKQQTRYVRHKMHMERMMYYFPRNIVLRLPTVVGHTNNSNTFFNFFKNRILSGETLNILLGATRHLIDVDDVKKFGTLIIDKENQNKEPFRKKIEIGFDNQMSVDDIVEIMLYILDKNNELIMNGTGSDYDFPKEQCKGYMKEFNYIIPEDYNYKLLKKYL